MSPPPAHEPFLRAICAAPDDDAPRLVFADYLDETGDPERAEFIRLQIQFARTPDVYGPERRRCDELFRARRRRWLAELPGPPELWAESSLAGQPPIHFESPHWSDQEHTWVECVPALGDWERGFPAAVRVQGSGDLLLAHADRVTEFVPVRRLHLVNPDRPDELIRALAGLPFLRKLRELILPFPLSDDTAEALALSPHASGLRQVSLVADQMTDRAGRAFAESPNLGDVDMLLLLRNEFNGSTRARLRARYGFRVHC